MSIFWTIMFVCYAIIAISLCFSVYYLLRANHHMKEAKRHWRKAEEYQWRTNELRWGRQP